MTKLDQTQERLLKDAERARDQVNEALERLQADYELAVYRAKAPALRAIENAQKGGVPLSRISKEAFGFSYPQKLTTWMQVPESVGKRLLNGDPVLSFETELEAAVSKIDSVTRDPSDGEIIVVQDGETYSVPSNGPDEEMWSVVNDDIPQFVYDAVKRRFPQWILLEDD